MVWKKQNKTKKQQQINEIDQWNSILKLFLKSDGDIVDASIQPSVCPSACHYFLLNHWAVFYQTCYITLPHVKGVWDHIIFLCIRPGIFLPI